MDERDYQIHEWFNKILNNLDYICEDQFYDLHKDVKELFEKHFETTEENNDYRPEDGI